MKFVQARNFTKASRTEVDLVVVHDMEYPERPNGAEWCADFFAGPNAPKASAHYCVDNDSIVQCVRDEDVAWHAPGANHNGIGIEHAGYAKQTADEWLDDYSIAMLERSAELVAMLCRKYGIPVERPSVDALKAGARGIVGHKDCTDAFSGGKGHWDPGPGFPWAHYLDRVRDHLDAGAYEPPAPDDRPEGWVSVFSDGVEWYVAPIYIHPMGIGAAEDYARAYGCELPSPALVDAIWRDADLRIDATKMVRQHDNTLKTMASREMFDSQAALVERAFAGRDFRLAAGYCKDVVAHNGKVGLYGWHRLDGSVIQPFYAGHARGWIDYSQGLRLVRRA